MPIWLIVVLVVLLVLAVGGAVARAQQLKRDRGRFQARLEQVNHDLADAAAQDRGWDRDTLEGAARRIYAEQQGSEPSELLLVEVLDRPGTDEDQAIFRTTTEGVHHHLTLGRRDGEWMLERFE